MTHAELLALAKKATPGPWEVCAADEAGEACPVAFFGRGTGPKDVAIRAQTQCPGTAEDDAAFVAACRTEVPRLLSKIAAYEHACAIYRSLLSDA